MNRHTAFRRPTAAAAVLAVAALAAAGQASAEPISARFDGTYTGRGDLVEPLSGPECPAPTRYELEIRNGAIAGEAVSLGTADPATYTVEGIVTSDGFFTGRREAGSMAPTLIQGRIEGETMVGGLFTKDETCAWIIKLDKA